MPLPSAGGARAAGADDEQSPSPQASSLSGLIYGPMYFHNCCRCLFSVPIWCVHPFCSMKWTSDARCLFSVPIWCVHPFCSMKWTSDATVCIK